jgi:hypothetical protein
MQYQLIEKASTICVTSRIFQWKIVEFHISALNMWLNVAEILAIESNEPLSPKKKIINKK